jgi:hypothetical protein
MLVLIVPFHLQSVKTTCLQEYEISIDGTLDDHDLVSRDNRGLTIVQALITIAVIIFASFFVSLFSIDIERYHTYKELEEAAHEERIPKLNRASIRASMRASVLQERRASRRPTTGSGDFSWFSGRISGDYGSGGSSRFSGDQSVGSSWLGSFGRSSSIAPIPSFKEYASHKSASASFKATPAPYEDMPESNIKMRGFKQSPSVVQEEDEDDSPRSSISASTPTGGAASIEQLEDQFAGLKETRLPEQRNLKCITDSPRGHDEEEEMKRETPLCTTPHSSARHSTGIGAVFKNTKEQEEDMLRMLRVTSEEQSNSSITNNDTVQV